MAITIETVAKGRLLAAGSSQVPIVNVFNWTQSVAGISVSKPAVLTAFSAAITIPWLNAVCDRYILDTVDIRIIDDADDQYQTFPFNTPGNIATDSLPSVITVFMYYQPNVRVRTARGNKKFAGCPESHTVGDVLQGAGLVLWQTFRDAIKNGFFDPQGNTWVPCVVSRKPPAQYSVNPVTKVDFVSKAILLNKRVGRLKRRAAKSVY